MITREWAWDFAVEWVEAWNTHDLDRILSHYTEDFEMSSPYIAQLMHEPSGTLKGKAQVREYWKVALTKIPDLRFELVEVFTSGNSIAIYYRGALDKRVVETLFFGAEGKAYKAVAHYNSI